MHTETTLAGLPRRNGTVLRSPTRTGAPAGDMLFIEQDSGGQLTARRFHTGPGGPTFERMTFRRAVTTGACVSYEPAAVRLLGERIMSGSSILMTFADPRDRDLGLSLARSFSRYCTIGSRNARADRLRYVFEYWEGGRGGDTRAHLRLHAL